MAPVYAGFKGAVTQEGEARRFHLLAPPVVSGSTSFVPVSSGTRNIQLSAGTLMACGIHVNETAVTNIAIPANTSGNPRWDLVGLRFTWTPGGAGTVTTFVRSGVPAASPGSPTPVREPGVSYEMVIAQVYVRNAVGVINSADVFDLRIWGGVGGPYKGVATTNQGRIDVPVGTELLIGTSLYQATAYNPATGFITWTVIDPQTTAWKAYVPNLRNASGGLVTATTFWKNGRYRIQDGVCHTKIQLGLYGAIGNTGGPYTVDLPVTIGASITDQWADGGLRLVGDSFRIWPAKWLLRAGAIRAQLQSITMSNDVRVLPAMSTPETITLELSYLIN